MKVISVNVGLPREVEWHGRKVRTSIWKTPKSGRVRVGALNLDGDAQSDLTVHGGREKAVYVYPSEHYAFWRAELERDLPWGSFGENLTTESLLENELRIGDALRIGSAEFVITQPRLPCFKLGIRFSDDRMIKRFLLSGRSGFYLAVLREGDVGAGDAIQLTTRSSNTPSVTDVVARYTIGP